MRNPTFAAREEIKREEALRLEAYRDFKGVPTIGWGHTRGVTMGMRITEQQAIDLLDEDIAEAVRTIYRHLPVDLIDALPVKCFDALVSFIFNVGEQAFRDPKTGKRTQFFRAITTDLALVPAQMLRWVRSGNKEAPGLVARRGREAAMWGAGLLERQQSDAHALGPESGIEPVDDVLDASVTPDAPRAEPVTKQPTGVTGIGLGAAGATAAGAAALEQANMLSRMNTDSVILVVLAAVLTIGAIGFLGYAAWRRFRPS